MFMSTMPKQSFMLVLDVLQSNLDTYVVSLFSLPNSKIEFEAEGLVSVSTFWGTVLSRVIGLEKFGYSYVDQLL